ncbi:MAG: NAD-binding protein [Armatimonadetes bacterium]|nr:NAD-binding protein [Armatimonadota bacterium]
MFIVIVGGGRTGSHLALLLLEEGHRVALIEHRPEMLERLHRELPTECVVQGIPTDPEVLEHAGIRTADALAACYPEDADNLVVCYLARKHYGVRRIIGRVSNPRNSWLYDEKFCVDIALHQPQVLASLIEEQMVVGDMVTLLKLHRGAFSLVEDTIPEGAAAVGKALRDLTLPESCVIVAVIREGEVVVPRGQTVFAAGDEVLALTDRDGRDVIARLFGGPPNGA